MDKLKTTEEAGYVFKVLLLGESNVGKTSLSNRFVKREFYHNYAATLCLDMFRTTINVGKHKVALQIWDTVGQERFRTVTSSYYKGSSVIMTQDRKGLLLSSAKSSFNTINTWVDSIKEYTDFSALCLMVIGNKCDLAEEREHVSFEDGEKLASSLGLKYYETSAMSGTNVDFIFAELAEAMIVKEQSRSGVGSPKKPEGVDLSKKLQETQAPANLNIENMLKMKKRKFKLSSMC